MERGKEMRRTSKTKAALLFSLLFAVVVSFTAFTAIVSAESSDNKPPVDKKEIFKDVTESGKALESEDDPDINGVHADPTVFEKNFCLSVGEKEETITEIEKVISYYIKPGMSDLEKYYTLAKWTNQRVDYDTDFWPAGYNLDYYRHQWDAYGAINEDEKSVCAGIAVFYANMCHAAGLPCYFVRLDPKTLDHTITYIPDINGHAYYADITENDFLMSHDACWFAENADLGFSGITKDNATDSTFEYQDEYGSLRASDIKECWQDKISYKKWFKEYALHEGTEKNFQTPYPENAPSSKDGVPYASYADFNKYPPQPYASRNPDDLNDAVTGSWFLDDFYAKPAEAKSMIEGKELNEQFLNISGVKENYDCGSTGDLVEAVTDDISIKYFPSLNDDGEIVPKEVSLKKDADNADYSVTYDRHDDTTGEEVLTIQGIGSYTGSCKLRVRMNSAFVKTPPARINSLVYNESPQKLVEPGEAGNGTMFYAVCDPEKEPADNDYSETIPTRTNAGKYDIWYKVIGDETHSDIPAQKLIIPNLTNHHRPVRIVPRDIEESGKIKLSKTAFTYNGKVQKPSVTATGLTEGRDYEVVGWDNPSSKNAGIYSVTIEGRGNYDGDTWKEYQIDKAANPMKLKPKTARIKYKKLKKKTQTIKRAKVVTVSKAKGNPTYKLVSAKKGKKNFKKKFKINAKTGNVTVKKGLKKGTYKIKIKVKAAGSDNYKASAWKNVTFKVKVK